MSDGKIYITISDRRGEPDTPTPSVPGTEKKEKKDKNDLFTHWAKNQLIGEVKQLANTAVTFGISNYGNFTGDFQAQRDIDAAMGIMSNISSIVMGGVAGSTFGPAGSIIGIAIATTNVAVNKGLSLYTEALNRRRTNREIDILRQRAGLDVLLDGSRGTEN